MDYKKISTGDAAKRMGVSRRRIYAMIKDDCPKCSGAGCEVCFGTGRRLPAERLGGDGNWLVFEDGLDLEHNRKRSAGRPVGSGGE